MSIYVRCYKDYRHKVPNYIYNYIWKNKIYKAEKENDKWLFKSQLHCVSLDYDLEISEEDFNKHFKIISNDLSGYYLWSGHHFYQQANGLFGIYGNSYELVCKCSNKIDFKISTKNKLFYSMETYTIFTNYHCDKCKRNHEIEIDFRNKIIKGDNQIDLRLKEVYQRIFPTAAKRLYYFQQENHLKLVK